jgi:hypothetical protein
VRVALLLLLAACGRWGFEERTQVVVDGAEPDAPGVVIDAAPDAPPMVVDTIIVPSDGTIVMSTFVPAAGVTYRLRASGTFTAVPPAEDPLADAEYYNRTGSSGPTDIGSSIDVGLAIDDDVVDDMKTPHWGPFAANGIYEVDYVGTGAPLGAQIHDCCYGDNVGTLTLEILAF